MRSSSYCKKSRPFRSELTGDDAVLGRHPECPINSTPHGSPRKHGARVFAMATRAASVDMGSGNGTFVNGQKIAGAKNAGHGRTVINWPLLFRFESAAKLVYHAPTPGFCPAT